VVRGGVAQVHNVAADGGVQIQRGLERGKVELVDGGELLVGNELAVDGVAGEALAQLALCGSLDVPDELGRGRASRG